MQWDLVWRLYRPLRGLPCDVRQRRVLDIAIDEVFEGIVYARGTPDHIDYCGTHRSDSPIRTL
jgi:hypothetical protein